MSIVNGRHTANAEDGALAPVKVVERQLRAGLRPVRMPPNEPGRGGSSAGLGARQRAPPRTARTASSSVSIEGGDDPERPWSRRSGAAVRSGPADRRRASVRGLSASRRRARRLAPPMPGGAPTAPWWSRTAHPRARIPPPPSCRPVGDALRERHPELLLHVAQRVVHGHRLGPDHAYAEPGEPFGQQGLRDFRGVAPAPGRPAQAVTESGLLARAAAQLARAAPADERAAVLLVRGEQAEVVIPSLVAGEDARDGEVPGPADGIGAPPVRYRITAGSLSSANSRSASAAEKGARADARTRGRRSLEDHGRKQGRTDSRAVCHPGGCQGAAAGHDRLRP